MGGSPLHFHWISFLSAAPGRRCCYWIAKRYRSNLLDNLSYFHVKAVEGIALPTLGKYALALAILFRSSVAISGVNPLQPGLPYSTVYGVQTDNNYMSALCVDCHTRMPASPDNTVKGSHFVYRDSSHPTRNLSWEKTEAWDNTTNSKYGDTPTTANKPQGTPGEMICESCHNLMKNSGTNKLLAADSEATDPNDLCMGCHTPSTLPGHHPMTGDPITTRGDLPLSTTGGSALSTPLDNATYPGTDKLNCRSCHKPHGAQTVTGARLLKIGVGAGVQGQATSGIDRQYDIDPTDTQRMVTDYTPLCLSCHTK